MYVFICVNVTLIADASGEKHDEPDVVLPDAPPHVGSRVGRQRLNDVEHLAPATDARLHKQRGNLPILLAVQLQRVNSNHVCNYKLCNSCITLPVTYAIT